ncbi:MAG: CoA transferase [Burkholderiales bacterium]|nr:CoA transferase [Burkholderiales bacterium]
MKKTLPKKNYEPGAKGALDGVRVLDLSRLVAGNQLTQVLGDFGAEVDRAIEVAGGDSAARAAFRGVQTNWHHAQQESLGLELRRPEARELLLKPSRRSVFVESFPSRHAREIGFRCRRRCSNATSSSSCAFRLGTAGRTARRPGFGTLDRKGCRASPVQWLRRLEPVLPAMYLADTVFSLYGASAVTLVKAKEVDNGGRGQVIDLPLLDPDVQLGLQAANYRLTAQVKPRNRQPPLPTRGRAMPTCARTAASVCLSVVVTQKMAERLFRSIGRPELID